MTDLPPLDSDLRELIALLREEANALKDCFTRYSFQAMAFSGAALGLVAHYLWEKPITALASIAVCAIALSTNRIGTFKYAAANRNLGYELHLYRTRSVPDEFRGRWRPHMQQIGWEEAMRAWRVVQATLFETVYVSRRVFPNFERRKFRKLKKVWFRQESMLEKKRGVTYHPGSYLRTMMLWLHTFAVAALCYLVVMTYLFFEEKWKFRGALSLLLLMSVITVLKIVMDDVRRKILEDGLLSIHSCAIVWQAVVIAHYSALNQVRLAEEKEVDGSGYKGYTEWLGREAESLAKHADDIHGWIGGKYHAELQ